MSDVFGVVGLFRSHTLPNRNSYPLKLSWYIEVTCLLKLNNKVFIVIIHLTEVILNLYPNCLIICGLHFNVTLLEVNSNYCDRLNFCLYFIF